MDTEALIKSLCEESKKQKICCPLRTFVFGVLSVGLYLFVFFALIGFRPDIIDRLGALPYLLEISFGALTLLLAIFAASWQAFPDLSEQKAIAWLPVIPLFGFLASFGLGFALSPEGNVDVSYGMSCAMHMCLIALLPTILLYVVLARGVFLHAGRASLHVGLAAAMASYLVARLAEETDDMLHLLIWHLLPLFGLMLLLGGIHWWLMRRKSRRL